MAVTITLEDEEDASTREGVHYIRRIFRYQRGAGDDGNVIITPTGGSAANQKKGFVEAPWAGIMGLTLENNSGGARTIITPPSPHISLVKDIDDTIVIGDGQDMESVQSRGWPASLNDGVEEFRCHPVGSQIAGGFLYWVVFASQNAAAADWNIGWNIAEGA